MEKRQEVLRDCCREKRSYVKRKSLFWSEGGKQEAARKVVRISTTPVMEQNAITLERNVLSHNKLKKMIANELIVLLAELTGKVFSKKTRMQDLISAYMEANIPRQN